MTRAQVPLTLATRGLARGALNGRLSRERDHSNPSAVPGPGIGGC
jgi:hypothetical protein